MADLGSHQVFDCFIDLALSKKKKNLSDFHNIWTLSETNNYGFFKNYYIDFHEIQMEDCFFFFCFCFVF